MNTVCSAYAQECCGVGSRVLVGGSDGRLIRTCLGTAVPERASGAAQNILLGWRSASLRYPAAAFPRDHGVHSPHALHIAFLGGRALGFGEILRFRERVVRLTLLRKGGKRPESHGEPPHCPSVV